MENELGPTEPVLGSFERAGDKESNGATPSRIGEILRVLHKFWFQNHKFWGIVLAKNMARFSINSGF